MIYNLPTSEVDLSNLEVYSWNSVVMLKVITIFYVIQPEVSVSSTLMLIIGYMLLFFRDNRHE